MEIKSSHTILESDLVDEEIRSGSVCAAVVTFFPDGDIHERISKIKEIVGSLVVIDNGSPPDTLTKLEDLSQRIRFDLVINKRNVGLATALNQAAKWAADRSFGWILLFDQDSKPAPNCVSVLRRIVDDYPKGPIAVVGCNFFDVNKKQIFFRERGSLVGNPVAFFVDTFSLGGVKFQNEREWAHAVVVITSGSLVSIPAYKVIGPFRDEFFIDQIDVDYCLRARAKGYAVLVSREPLINHSIGSYTIHKLLWMNMPASNHSPLRRYFMSRNRMILLREHFRNDKLLTTATIGAIIFPSIAILLFEQDRVRKIKMIIRGLADGFYFNEKRLNRESSNLKK